MALSVTAGGAATAQQFNSLVPRYYRQGAAQVLATTTFTTHSTFTALPVLVGEVWQVELVAGLTSANVGNGIKLRWVATGGTALITNRHIIGQGLVGAAGAAGTSVDTTGNFQARNLGDSVSGGVTNSGAVCTTWQEKFLIRSLGSDGTFGLEWGQNAAVSGSTTFLQNSYIIMHRLE